MTGIDPAMARALDRLDPPPMSDDFTARVLAATGAEGAALPALPKSRSAPRSLWRRSRNLVIGVTALSLVSAAAAATGLLGERAQGLPVISVIAAKIAPHRKASSEKLHPALAAAPAAAAPAATGQVEPAEAPTSVREARREAVEKWVAARRERRAAMGLPTASPQAVAAIRERLAQMPPAERRALVERALEKRRAARGATVPGANLAAPAHPLRDAIMQRREAVAASRAEPVAANAEPSAMPVPAASPDAAANSPVTARQQPAAERLRQLREQRERRRELRRQRGV